jgi:hypothetical protein
VWRKNFPRKNTLAVVPVIDGDAGRLTELILNTLAV